jgi:Uma2 family endonuclease
MTAQDQLDARNKHRLTVDEFLLLDREGAFGDRRTELFEGEVYYMSPKHRPHARAVTQLVVALANALEESGSGLNVLTDISVRLSGHDVPEPDIAITDAPEGDGILPLESAKLLIEVADSTLTQDLGLKVALYAVASVPEYWVVDVNGRVIHQMWAPGAQGYTERREVVFGERIEAATIEVLAVETGSL